MLNKSGEAAGREGSEGAGDPGRLGDRGGGGGGPAVGPGEGGPFVFSQVQLLGLNRWHPLVARGRAADAAVAGQGPGDLLTRAILCPDRSKGWGLHCYPQQGSHLGCHQGYLGDIPRRGRSEEGLPDVGKESPPLIAVGRLF